MVVPASTDPAVVSGTRHSPQRNALAGGGARAVTWFGDSAQPNDSDTRVVGSCIARNVGSLQGDGNGGGIWAAGGQIIRGNVIEDNTPPFPNCPGTRRVLITSQQEQTGGPRFTDGASSDFTLFHDSPCIETGNPATPVPENGVGWSTSTRPGPPACST